MKFVKIHEKYMKIHEISQEISKDIENLKHYHKSCSTGHLYRTLYPITPYKLFSSVPS